MKVQRYVIMGQNVFDESTKITTVIYMYFV